MTGSRSLSPAAEACLCRAYPSSQKGGTLIAGDVHDLATHELRLEDPDSYRPSSCPRCGASLHIHDLRPRALRGEPQVATEVIRFRCADRDRCGAAWQILPVFLARCLWGSWSRVREALEGDSWSPVPARTRRRWTTRLESTARLLVVVLSTATDGVWARLAMGVGLAARRLDLVQHTTAELSSRVAMPGDSWALLAAAVHRLSPGVRLM
ncbi:MAG: hypothetical protein JRF63_15530 [Deltaproteobacteria bacterium]|nr:hypothetical protein [Deltaproteobacteria bacterium]